MGTYRVNGDVRLIKKEKANDMSDNPYDRFKKDDLILRDELAIDRTILANERTALSYLRGSVTLIIAGVTFVHFVEQGLLHSLGLCLIPLGLVAGIVGTIRYKKMDKQIRTIRHDMNRTKDKS